MYVQIKIRGEAFKAYRIIHFRAEDIEYPTRLFFVHFYACICI